MTYGNLINRIGENFKGKTPEVGMGATLYSYSDRYAYTIIRVSANGKSLWATLDKAIRIDENGMSDSQSYRYETIENSHEELFTLRKDGRWHKGTTLGGLVLGIGHRDAYHDYSF